MSSCPSLSQLVSSSFITRSQMAKHTASVLIYLSRTVSYKIFQSNLGLLISVIVLFCLVPSHSFALKCRSRSCLVRYDGFRGSQLLSFGLGFVTDRTKHTKRSSALHSVTILLAYVLVEPRIPTSPYAMREWSSGEDRLFTTFLHKYLHLRL
jgi:hypothetical protein